MTRTRPNGHAARTRPDDRVTRRRRDDQATRRQVLDAATRQFSALGYNHVTIRAICKEARANIAAVNYHFGDKLGLYTEVLESAFSVVRETTARAIAAGEGRPPAEKISAYIAVHAEVLLATTGPSAIQQLIHREMHEPTAGVQALVERLFKPRFEYLFSIIGEFLELPPDDERVRMSAISVHGLILMFRPTPLTDRIGMLLKLKFSTERIATHLRLFALSALDAYRPGVMPVRSQRPSPSR